mgnify:FL=1
MDLPAILVACGLRSYGTVPQVWGGDPACAHDFRTRRYYTEKSAAAADGSAEAFSEPGPANAARLRAARWREDGVCRKCSAWKGEHGLEPTLDSWLEHEVLIWREVRRVLRSDGTAFINCGDAYATTPNGRSAADQKAAGTDDRTMRDKPVSTVSKRRTAGINREDIDVGGWGASDDSLRWRGGANFKPKDRLLMPHRLAIALHADGWWIRDEIVLSKLNPMPSSVKDRTCPAHEMLFMLSKSAKYFYDFAAIQEPANIDGGTHSSGSKLDPPSEHAGIGHKNWKRGTAAIVAKRLCRSVWSSATEPYIGAHFATAPTAWVRPCILAGTSAKGVCPHCGAPWRRQVEAGELGGEGKIQDMDRPAAEVRGVSSTSALRTNGRTWRERRDLGWSPSCACPDNVPIPATVLDIFAGAFTTSLVAEQLGRDSIAIELNPSYVELGRERLKADAGFLAEISEAPPAEVESPSAETPPGGLFT